MSERTLGCRSLRHLHYVLLFFTAQIDLYNINTEEDMTAHPHPQIFPKHLLL